MYVTQRRVAGYRRALMMSCDDVVNFKGSRVTGLPDKTVFTSMAGPFPD
jgi:hypothetical protein